MEPKTPRHSARLANHHQRGEEHYSARLITTSEPASESAKTQATPNKTAIRMSAEEANNTSSKRIRGMEGDGYYNRNSRPQAAGNELGLDFWRRAVDQVVNTGRHASFIRSQLETINIADYGSSQGRNSVPIVRAALDLIPERTSVVVTHLDLPTNDFNSLIQIAADKTHGYADDSRHDVFVSARGVSFYNKAFPDATVHLGWSAFATHWLSEVPEGPLNHFTVHRATNPERSVWVERAREDWKRFVGYRAQELVSNGHFIQVGIAMDDHGLTGSEGIFDLLEQSLKPVLSAETYARLRLPVYSRTVQEWLEPFQADPETWRIANVATRSAVNPFWAEFERDGDLEKFVESVTGVVRAAYMAGLIREEAIDLGDFYERFKAGLRANPSLGKLDWRLVLLDVERL